jgi:hypothetical protein
MKKLLALVALVGMGLFIAGCGEEPKKSEGTSKPNMTGPGSVSTGPKAGADADKDKDGDKDKDADKGKDMPEDGDKGGDAADDKPADSGDKPADEGSEDDKPSE